MSLWLIALPLSIMLIIFTATRKFSKAWLKAMILFFDTLLIFAILIRLIFPFSAMPEPTGQYSVQVDKIYYEHETKYPDMATGGMLREIPIHVYYPEKLKERSHPLFIFSHGSFGVGSSNESLFFELASQGYIVMSLDHPHHAFFTTLSSGKTVFVDRKFFKDVISSPGSKDLEKTFDDLNRWVDPRIEDINFVLDTILDKKEDNVYESKVDREKIIVSGHSLGGSAALAIGRERPEDVFSLVILEAPFVKDILSIKDGKYIFVDEDYPRPILHIYSDALWAKMDSVATYALNEKMIEAKDPKFTNKHIEGVGHIGLTDMIRVSPFLTNMIDGGLNKKKGNEGLVEINEAALDFLAEVDQDMSRDPKQDEKDELG